MSMVRIPSGSGAVVAIQPDADNNGRASHSDTTPMPASFAQIRTPLQALCLGGVLALTSCASLPPPTAELASAQQAVSRADMADADQYAPEAVERARTALRHAQAAMANGREGDARNLALLSAAAADLAHARSRQAQAETELAQRRSEVASLRQRLEQEGTP
jgi:multidrug resistance efflux pump